MAWACVLGAAFLYLVGDLVVPTMALDGVVYAGIARHLSEGLGSFWFPPHFEAAASAFHDHPPLGVWLQSLWFELWGDAFWVESLYCAALFLLLAWLVGVVHREMSGDRSVWWPLLLLLLMPVTTRVIKNNLLEMLVTLAALAAVWAAWRGRRQIGWDVAVGGLCVAGFLIKGPAAVFPLIAPAVFALVLERSLTRAAVRSVVCGLAFVLPLAALLSYPPALESLRAYVDVQLVATFMGERAPEHGRLYQLGQLTLQLAAAGVVALVLSLVRRARPPVSREAIAVFVIALAGSLPLLLSPRQYRTYLFPALPLFALALTLVVHAPAVTRWRRALPLVCAGLLLAVAVRTAMLYGQPGDDRTLFADAGRIAAIAEAREVTTVGFCEPTFQLRLYLWRYHSLRSSWGAAPAERLWICEASADAEQLAELTDGQVLWWRPLD